MDAQHQKLKKPSGRPAGTGMRVDGEALERVIVQLSPAQIEYARKLGYNNLAAGIRRLIDEHRLIAS